MNRSRPGSALLLTIMLIVLLSLQVAILSMVAVRGLGDEGMMMSQNIAARRAAETAISTLQEQMYQELTTMSPDQVLAAHASGSGAVMTALNPDTAASDPTNITTSAWVVERRGNLYHLVGRAVVGGADLLVHKWVRIKPCTGSLLTLVSGDRIGYSDNYPVDSSIRTAPDGRVFFGQKGGGSGTSVWTWSEATGLSVLVSGLSEGGQDNIDIASDGRVFFGSGNSRYYWTWKSNTGLSTIINDNTSGGWGRQSHVVSPVDGRIMIGEWENTAAAKMYTWKDNGTGAGVLSVVLSGQPNPGEDSAIAVSSDGRFYFGLNTSPGSFYTWKEFQGLSIILGPAASSTNPGRYGVATAPDGRVYFGEDTSPGRFWTWNPKDNGLTLLQSGLYKPGENKLIGVSPVDGRVVFAGRSGSNRCTTWKAGTALSTLVSGSGICSDNIAVTPDGRFILSGNASNLYAWKDDGTNSGVLSTIITGRTNAGGTGMMAVGADGRVFFADEATPGSVWAWKDNGTGAGVLSTIVTSVTLLQPGNGFVMQASPNGRVFFGESTTSGKFFTWAPTTGLTTIVTGRNFPGSEAIWTGPDGRVFFGEYTANPGNFYTWKVPSCDVN